MLLLRAIARRDWQVERTYQLSVLLVFTDALVLGISIYFISNLVGDTSALDGYQGSYFDFALVGLAVNSFAGVGLQGFAGAVVREQSTGTIDPLLAAPTSHPMLISGMFLFPFAEAFVQVFILLIVGIGFIGSGISLGSLLICIPILVLTSVTFAAVGIAAAGVLIVTKRGDPISAAFYQASILLSGTLFPVGELPRILQVIAAFLPATWAVRAMRELLLGHAGWRDVAPEALILCAFAVVMVPIGYWVFHRCLDTARRLGIVGSY